MEFKAPQLLQMPKWSTWYCLVGEKCYNETKISYMQRARIEWGCYVLSSAYKDRDTKCWVSLTGSTKLWALVWRSTGFQ